MFLFQLYERTCKLLVLKLPLNFFNRIFPFRCKFEKYILISSSAVTFLLSLSIIQSVQFCFMRFMLLSKRCAASNAKSNERETSSNVRARFFCKWLIIEENGSRDEGVSEWGREKQMMMKKNEIKDAKEKWNIAFGVFFWMLHFCIVPNLVKCALGRIRTKMAALEGPPLRFDLLLPL